MATMEASKPEYSLATVFDADTSVTGLYGLGDDIRPGVVVLGIDLGVVHIRNNAQLEYIEVGADVKASVAPTAAATDKPAPKKPSPSAIDGAEEAIKCSSENQCVVERQFVEQLMANPAMLAKQARIVPSQRDGETQGFKFYGIRRGSLPKLLGLNNGDMLTEVNGEAMTSVDQAMGLAMKLRRASNLSVTLVRKGKTITKEIQIQ
jgi:general secretion pathway protein C